MNLKDAIKTAKETATTHDEMIMAEGFEDYVDLLDMLKGAETDDKAEIMSRLHSKFASLREVATRFFMGQGIDYLSFFDNYLTPEVLTRNMDVPAPKKQSTGRPAKRINTSLMI